LRNSCIDNHWFESEDLVTYPEFAAQTPETAPAAARPLLRASAEQFGFLPSPVARAAQSPALLKHLLAGFGAFDQTALSPIEREVVAFTVAFEIGCHYCMALHSALVARTPAVPQGFVEALRAGTALAQPRLEALRSFVQDLVRNRGRVSDARWTALEAAGFTEAQALDAVLGTGVYLLSTLTNVVTRAEVDPAFEPFRWTRPE
jgi:AhpD family alkylhydroperoxidase